MSNDSLSAGPNREQLMAIIEGLYAELRGVLREIKNHPEAPKSFVENESVQRFLSLSESKGELTPRD